MKYIQFFIMSIALMSSMPLFSLDNWFSWFDSGKRGLEKQEYRSSYSGRKDVGAKDLFEAIDAENVDQVKTLLQRKRIDPNVMYNKTTALLQAIALPDKKIAKQIVTLLLEHGADPNIADEFGMLPLVYAQYVEKRKIVRLLLQHGATVVAHKVLREEPGLKGKCPYKKEVKELAKEFYFVPEEEEEDWTMIEKPETEEEEWQMLRSKL